MYKLVVPEKLDFQAAITAVGVVRLQADGRELAGTKLLVRH